MTNFSQLRGVIIIQNGILLASLKKPKTKLLKWPVYPPTSHP